MLGPSRVICPSLVHYIGAIDEAEHGSVTKAAECAAQEILDELCKEEASGQQTTQQEGAEALGPPRSKPASVSQWPAAAAAAAGRLSARVPGTALQGISEEIERCVQRKDFAQAAALDALLKTLSPSSTLQQEVPASGGHPGEQTQAKRTSMDVPVVDPPEFGERVQDFNNKDPY